MGKPKSPEVLYLAVAWSSQLQSHLEKLCTSGVRFKNLVISLPRDVYYAITSNRDLLEQHFSFLSTAGISLRNIPTASNASDIHFTYDIQPVRNNSKEFYSLLLDAAVPNCIPKLKIPPHIWSQKTAWEYSQRGELNVYRKNAEEKYLEWCKENNQEPEYIIIQQGVGGDCNSKKAEGRWW